MTLREMEQQTSCRHVKTALTKVMANAVKTLLGVVLFTHGKSYMYSATSIDLEQSVLKSISSLKNPHRTEKHP